jgi:D-alanine transaminase
MTIAYLDGKFLPLDSARISPLDRGFLFGDGVYEVVPVYGGILFRLEAHLDRLERSLAGLRIANPFDRAGWTGLLEDLVARNGGGEQAVYWQVTRGVAPRNHAFPANARPTVFAMTRCHERPPAVRPVSAVIREDNRWGRCDLKTIALLGNCLLRQEAIDAGTDEAILFRDGEITEGAATNVFVVRGGHIATPPKGPRLLPGITRDVVIEIARELGLECREEAVPVEALDAADEVWITSASMEVSPVVRIEGRAVGEGRPGPVWEGVYGRFRELQEGLRDRPPAAAAAAG